MGCSVQNTYTCSFAIKNGIGNASISQLLSLYRPYRLQNLRHNRGLLPKKARHFFHSPSCLLVHFHWHFFDTFIKEIIEIIMHHRDALRVVPGHISVTFLEGRIFLSIFRCSFQPFTTKHLNGYYNMQLANILVFTWLPGGKPFQKRAPALRTWTWLLRLGMVGWSQFEGYGYCT